VIAVFDRLYDTVHTGRPVDADLLGALNATHQVLGPRIAEQQRAIGRALRRRRGEAASEAPDDRVVDPDQEELPTW
jgi:hypothetical protein